MTGSLVMDLVVGWIEYLWSLTTAMKTTTMRTTNLVLCQLLHQVFNSHQWDQLYHLDHQGLEPLPFALFENVIQVSNGFYAWHAMMRRMSKCTFLSNSLLFITIVRVARHFSQAAPQACLLSCRSLSQRSHTDSGMCRWDSDDLPEISDDEWDDEE